MTDDSRPTTTEIMLLGQGYVIACPPEEQEQLNRAAHYLDRAMHGIHARGKVLGAEKIAIMAALNITHELLRTLEERKECEATLARLSERLEQALTNAPSR
ncbi:cell division protein ZapA [Litchfieldella qijiaojingensis]|uniref:Cell division protein ZapA n=1 Tax=Litchfieldella qijiaojingensis TaxID=980347 RepID=A0ABQ2YGV1_9GAMM|nr:cell division protein ZapA [Halomonas qijiaojingensis]GGX83938.1 cell division protein ZapA [Halomonas qijiaojingensis]